MGSRSRSAFLPPFRASLRAQLSPPSAWDLLPAAQVAASLLSTTSAGDAGKPPASAGARGFETLELLEGEDDETRFKPRKDRDWGPGARPTGWAPSAPEARAAEGAGAAGAGGWGGDEDWELASDDEDAPVKEEDEDDDLFARGGGSDEEAGSDGDGGRGALRGALDDVPYTGPTRLAVVGDGWDRELTAGARAPPHAKPLGVPDFSLASVAMLQDSGEWAPPPPAGAPYGVPPPRSAAQEKRAMRNAVIMRRALRANYSEREIQDVAMAQWLQHRGDFGGVPLTPGHDPVNYMAARRETDYRPGEDPLTGAPPSCPFPAAGARGQPQREGSRHTSSPPAAQTAGPRIAGGSCSRSARSRAGAPSPPRSGSSRPRGRGGAKARAPQSEELAAAKCRTQTMEGAACPSQRGPKLLGVTRPAAKIRCFFILHKQHRRCAPRTHTAARRWTV